MLYLAYGSNLSNETFRGNRGIKPLSQVNVQVPSLRLTLDYRMQSHALQTLDEGTRRMTLLKTLAAQSVTRSMEDPRCRLARRIIARIDGTRV
jgi:hypothetical protein